MDNKIGIQELAAAIAKAKEIDGSEAEIFCRSVFEIISDFLVKEKLVKIKGLGTFKLIDVSDRESINVNTGERIVIAGHTKMSFTPDAQLRDTVNRPFADFETTVLSENASTEKMEFIPAERVKPEEPKLADPKPAEPKQTEPKAEQPKLSEPNAEGPKEEAPKVVASKATESKEEPQSQPAAVQTPESTKPAESTHVQQPKPAKSVQPATSAQQPQSQPAQQPKGNRVWIYVLAIVAVAVCSILFLAGQFKTEKVPTVDPAVIEKLKADSIAAVQAAEKARIEKLIADSIAKAKRDSDSIAKINQAVLEYYEKHPEQRWRLERALRRSRARARRRS